MPADDYMAELPNQPDLLQATKPSLYNKIMPPGGFIKCPLNLLELEWLDQSYTCRGAIVNSAGSTNAFDNMFPHLSSHRRPALADAGRDAELLKIQLCNLFGASCVVVSLSVLIGLTQMCLGST